MLNQIEKKYKYAFQMSERNLKAFDEETGEVIDKLPEPIYRKSSIMYKLKK